MRNMPIRFSAILLALSAGMCMPTMADAAAVRKKAAPVRVIKKAPAVRPAPVARVRAAAARVVHRAVQRVVVRTEPARVSFGQVFGLHQTSDALDLQSSVALVVDQDTQEVLLSKNSQAVLPIASLTKLMTAVVVTEARQPLDEVLTVTEEDIDTEKGSRSRLRVGSQLSRGEMMHIALMSSENRAANALGRHFPGGLAAFVSAMNRKAQALGMNDSQFVEPTGLSSRNQSSARDLATLVMAAHKHQIIRELSTSPEHQVDTGIQHLQYRNTNGLIRSPLVGDRPAEDGLYLRGRPLPRDAGQAGRSEAGDGVSRFQRQVLRAWATRNACASGSADSPPPRTPPGCPSWPPERCGCGGRGSLGEHSPGGTRTWSTGAVDSR